LIVALVNYNYFNNSIGPVWFATCVDENGKDIVLQVQDEILTPRFYILKKDKELAEKVWREKNCYELVKSIVDEPLKSAFGEELLKVTACQMGKDGCPRNAMEGISRSKRL
jgi:hypothetical protein